MVPGPRFPPTGAGARGPAGGTNEPMCGIVGYVGEQQSAPILVSGRKKLEYRGYDSAGLAVVNGGTLNVVRATGKLKTLEARIGSEPPSGTLGIGHTRGARPRRPGA